MLMLVLMLVLPLVVVYASSQSVKGDVPCSDMSFDLPFTSVDPNIGYFRAKTSSVRRSFEVEILDSKNQTPCKTCVAAYRASTEVSRCVIVL